MLNAVVVSIRFILLVGKVSCDAASLVDIGCPLTDNRYFRKTYHRPIMPIPNNSILKGDPQPGQVTGFPRISVFRCKRGAGTFTIDGNVQSLDNSVVLCAVLQNFTPPDAQVLLALPDGVTEVPRQPAGLRICVRTI